MHRILCWFERAVCLSDGIDGDGLQAESQSLIMSFKINIKTVVLDAASHILHRIDASVDKKTRADGIIIQIGGDGVPGFGPRAGIGQ